MKKLFRHITSVIIFSFVICLFLPLLAHADVSSGTELYKTNTAHDSGGYFYHLFTAQGYDSSLTPAILVLHVDDTTYTYGVLSNTRAMLDVSDQYFWSANGEDFSSSNTTVYSSYERVTNSDGNYCYYTPLTSYTKGNVFLPLQFSCPYVEFNSIEDLKEFVAKGDISDELPADTDTFTLDKNLGHVTNAKWKHLVSNDLKSQVVSDGFAQYGVGVDGTAKMDSYTYSRYASFSKDKCSFATKSSTGLNLLDSRYQLQYCSRVQMTFHYNLLGVIPTDNTKDYTKRFTSPKPYPAVDGCSFDAAKNIESLFSQGFSYNESLPAFGTALRNFLFDETKYWIDVRIVDKKTHTYGAWYAMALEDNKARVITTDDGDIGSDVDSEEDVGNYTKIEGTGDTFDDAEDNSHEVKDTEQFSKDKWTDASKGVKDSYSTAKTLIKMVAGLPQMIGTLFSWLPSWCLSLVGVFFSIIIVLALLRFVLGS